MNMSTSNELENLPLGLGDSILWDDFDFSKDWKKTHFKVFEENEKGSIILSMKGFKVIRYKVSEVEEGLWLLVYKKEKQRTKKIKTYTVCDAFVNGFGYLLNQLITVNKTLEEPFWEGFDFSKDWKYTHFKVFDFFDKGEELLVMESYKISKYKISVLGDGLFLLTYKKIRKEKKKLVSYMICDIIKRGKIQTNVLVRQR
jgi:hypothetical protein